MLLPKAAAPNTNILKPPSNGTDLVPPVEADAEAEAFPEVEVDVKVPPLDDADAEALADDDVVDVEIQDQDDGQDQAFMLQENVNAATTIRVCIVFENLFFVFIPEFIFKLINETKVCR